jgi:hypothetical protein
MESSVDTGDAADTTEVSEARSIDGEGADWAPRIEPVYYPGRGPCTLADYFSYAYGSTPVVADPTRSSDALYAEAPPIVSSLPPAPPPPPVEPTWRDDGQAPTLVSTILLPAPPPPPAEESTSREYGQEGTGLAKELRAIFPGAKIHLGPPPSPRANAPPAAATVPPPVARRSGTYADLLGAPPVGPPPAPPVTPPAAPPPPVYSEQLEGLMQNGLPPTPPVGAPVVPPPPVQPPGLETQSVSPHILFNLAGGSLGPPPAGAPSVAEVEASSKATSWRDRLRRNGEHHLGEVEAALKRRTELPPALGAAGAVPISLLSEMPAAGAPVLYDFATLAAAAVRQGPPDPLELLASAAMPVEPASTRIGLQMPPANGQLWPIEAVFPMSAAGLPPIAGTQPSLTSEAERLLAWQAHMQCTDSALWSNPAYLPDAGSPYVEAMSINNLYAADQMSMQMHQEAMPTEYSVNREDIAAQLRAAEPCCYED